MLIIPFRDFDVYFTGFQGVVDGLFTANFTPVLEEIDFSDLR